ncbi:hypothetical protein MRB53_041090 [Persea americana]|nr:hypothetical protein MRB53_041090 [Persea americana]
MQCKLGLKLRWSSRGHQVTGCCRCRSSMSTTLTRITTQPAVFEVLPPSLVARGYGTSVVILRFNSRRMHKITDEQLMGKGVTPASKNTAI